MEAGASETGPLPTIQGEHLWTIREPSQCTSDVGEYMDSAPFDLVGSTWALRLYPRGFAAQYRRFASVFLVHRGSKRTDVHVSFVLVDQTLTPIPGTERACQHKFETGNFVYSSNSPHHDNCWGFREAWVNVSSALFRNRLRIRCVVTLRAETSTTSSQLATTLRRDLGQLLDTGEHSDVKLLVGEAEFAVHKNILCTRSPVFQAMFRHGMKEKLEGVVCVEGVSAPVMQELLRFLYTGECKILSAATRVQEDDKEDDKANDKEDDQEDKREDKTEDNKEVNKKDKKEYKTDGDKEDKKEDKNSGVCATELMLAADRFDVPGLVSLCADRLYDYLTPENLADVFSLADLCRVGPLKHRLLDYVRHNRPLVCRMLSGPAFGRLERSQVQQLLGAVAGASSRNMSKKRKRASNDDGTDGSGPIKKLRITELRATLTGRGFDAQGTRSQLTKRLERAIVNESL